MKKLFPSLLATLQLFARTKRFKAYGLIPLVFLAGCIATENRIAAGKMREQVMRYYNDEIMENLIRASQKLAFVHVDVSSLTTTDVAQVTGSVGGGHTASETRTSPMQKALHSFGRTVTWPFTYSVSPNRSDSMQITANTVLGQFPADTSALPPPSLEVSKKTVTEKPEDEGTTEKQTEKTTEKKTGNTKEKSEETTGEKIHEKTGGQTGSPRQTPGMITSQIATEYAPPKSKSMTIYNLYEDFLTKKNAYKEGCPDAKGAKCADYKSPLGGPTDLLDRPNENEYVEGTLRIWHGHYYYIHRECQCEYYEFCKKLFTKSQANSVGQQFQALQNLIESVKGQLPPSAPQPVPP